MTFPVDFYLKRYFLPQKFLCGVLGVFLTLLPAVSFSAESSNNALDSAIAWNMNLSASNGGFWKKRIAFTLSISDEVIAELNRINAANAPNSGKEGKENSGTGMKSTLQPMEFKFTIATPEEKKAASPEQAQSMLPIAGARAQDIRVCDEKNVEYLFEILDSSDNPRHSGSLESGMQIIVPIELTTISRKPRFFVYFDNSESWIQSDWWSFKKFSNGSFEKGQDAAEVWQLDSGDDKHKIARTSDTARTGSCSMKTEVAADAKHSWIGARQISLPVRPGQKYRFSGWTKAENIEGYAGWFYHLGNASNGMVGSGMLSAGGGTYDWKKTSQEFTVPENVDRLTIGTVLRGTGTAWADDAELELLDDAEPNLTVPREIGEIETFPLTERYPSRKNPNGAESFDSIAFFGSKDLPRFAFIRVVNDSDAERRPLVNISSALLEARWRIDLNENSFEILALDGTSIPFKIWGDNLFITPFLPAKTVAYLILREKETAVSLSEAARQKRNDTLNDSGFPGTSLQQVGDVKKGVTLENISLLREILQNNMVKNSGFEEVDASGIPAGWTRGPEAKGISFITVDPNAPEDVLGKRCAQIKFDANAKAGWNGWRQAIPVVGNRTYFCGVWMKSNSENQKQYDVHVHFHQANGEHTLYGAMTSFGNIAGKVNEWVFVSGMLKAPEGATSMVLQLTTNTENDLFYDDVIVTEMEMGVPEKFQGGSVGIFQIPPIIKVFPDSTWTRNPKELKKLQFRTVSTAKNEEETLQFAVRFASDRNYQVALENAVSADGKTVLPTELFAVGYVPIKHVTSYYNTRIARWFRKLPGTGGRADGWVGYWPDPILRFSNLQQANSNSKSKFCSLEKARDVWNKLNGKEYSSDSERLVRFAEQNLIGFKAWETRPLIVLVKTEKDTPAGLYSGKIRLRNLETGKIIAIPFSVNVKDFAIPDEPVCGAIYDCRASHMEYWNASNGHDLVRNMIKFLASKRLSPDQLNVEPKFTYDGETGKWTADFEEFDKECEWYFNELKIHRAYLPGDWYCFGWGMPPHARQGIEPYEGKWPFEGVDRGKLRPEFKKVYQDKLHLMWNHLKEKGWDKKFVLYISDEPFYALPHIIEQMKACCAMIHEVDPNIPIYSSTWKHIPEWDGFITAWGIGHYGCVPEKQIEKSKARGDVIWWTTDGQMCTDTPFCATERLLPYWCVKYGADAYEFWGASWFTYDPYRYGWHSYIYQSDQPGVEYFVLYPNGDGYIFYPDKLIGVNEIVSSIRLEQAREGVEDAAYITILRDEIKRVEEMNKLDAAGKRTLTNAKNTLARVYDLVHIPNAGGRFTSHYLPNPEEVDEVKELVLQLIEDLQKIR